MTALAVLIPNSTLPLLTLVSLIGATASGYLAPAKRTVLWLGCVALIAAVIVWAGPGELNNNGLQWLAAAIVLIIVTAAVIYYIRKLEERAFEFSWQAEISAEAAELGVFRWDCDSDDLHANQKLRQLLQLPPGAKVYGEDVFSKVHEDDIDHLREELDIACDGERNFRAEFRVKIDGDRYRWIAGRGRAIVDPRSGALSLAGVNYDITEMKERESLVSKLIDGIGALFSITTPEGRILELNDFGEALSGVARDEWMNAQFWELGMWGRSKETRNAVRDLVKRTAAEGQVTGEAPFWKSDGEKGWALLTVTPIESDFGEPLHLCLCAVDISKRKTAEESNALLVQELNHRIKNLFSVTNALISLSARYATTVEDFAEATRQRLFALHAAHNVGAVDLKKRNADLREILETTLRPWRTDPQRIFIDGASLTLDAGAATAWALIVHELVSNAAKYGALKEAGGKLTIDWRDGEDALVFEWREESHQFSSGEASDDKGFGQTIVDRLVDGFLGGEIERTLTGQGVFVKITIEKHAEE
ncbi:PAS domain S-box protein [Hyphococcus luteus]|uniref:PAS domain S-box protein n=1 Tax=Hyphococcus luteus TaxID=2058213 RepID=UPI0013FD6A5A|nr:PAS domain S-box protein [Marinicaulis flavus]